MIDSNKRNFHQFSADHKLAFFTMETSVVTEVLPIQSLEIRPVTVITNTLNALSSIYSLENSPLVNLVLNPLTSQLPSNFTADNINYKGYVSVKFKHNLV